MHWTGTDVAAAAAAGTALGALVLFTWRRALGPLVRFGLRFQRDWEGEPARPKDGVPERPGMMKRMANVEELATATAAIVHAQLKPNGGTSMYDKVTRLDESMPPAAPEVHIHTGGSG